MKTVTDRGGELRLRIFETRYIDMVRLCTREQRPFGVCLFLDADGDLPARPAALGTAAKIVDFYTLPDGMLGLTCAGGERFGLWPCRDLCRAAGVVWPGAHALCCRRHCAVGRLCRCCHLS